MKHIKYQLEQEAFYLIINDEKLPCSLYYYAIEPNGLGEFETLLQVLNLFIERVENIFDYEILYFPVVFEDEYIGMLKVTKLLDENIRLEYGTTTEIGGYSIYPSQSLLVNEYEISKFNVEISTIASYNSFLQDLNDCAEYLNTLIE